MRTIKTGLYSDVAFNVLDAVLGQMSDGIWENSTRMDKYWRFLNIRRAENNEVILEVSSEAFSYNSRVPTPNALVTTSVTGILTWLGKMVKTVAKHEMADGGRGTWKRDENTVLHYLRQVPTKEVYLIYEHLLGRDHSKMVRNYGNPLLSKVFSKALTAEELEQKRLNAEIDKWEQEQLKMVKEQAQKRKQALQLLGVAAA